jgi:hypothetical protein
MICNATAVTIENFRVSFVVHLFDGKAEAPAEAHVLWALESCPAQSEQTEVLKRKTQKVLFALKIDFCKKRWQHSCACRFLRCSGIEGQCESGS